MIIVGSRFNQSSIYGFCNGSLSLSLPSLSSSLSSRQISPSGHFMRFVFQLIVGSEGVDVVCCSFLNRDSTQPERREKITLRMRLCSNLNLINTPQFREIQKEKFRRSEPNGKFSNNRLILGHGSKLDAVTKRLLLEENYRLEKLNHGHTRR